MKCAILIGVGFAAGLGGLIAGGVAAHAADSNRPDWAFNSHPFEARNPSPDHTLLSIIGSRFQFTTNHANGVQDDGTRNRVVTADWFPEEHPPMPTLVGIGDPPSARNILACSVCHMPEGRGRTEDAALSGLPADYIVQQLHDMKNGLRNTSDPRKDNAHRMVGYAKAMTEDEIQTVAKYYAAIPWVKWVNVVEAGTIPKATIEDGMWRTATDSKAGTEPLGNRIVEGPIDFEATELERDPHAGIIAYVPVGSIGAGRALATTGGDGKTMACAACHGVGLTGTPIAPPIAGRSASYLARQLYDFQVGARNGAGAQMMKPVAAKLTGDDIIKLTAYVASLPPMAAPDAK